MSFYFNDSGLSASLASVTPTTYLGGFFVDTSELQHCGPAIQRHEAVLHCSSGWVDQLQRGELQSNVGRGGETGSFFQM